MCMRISASNKNVVVSPYENMLDSVVVFRSDFLELDTVEKERDGSDNIGRGNDRTSSSPDRARN